MFSPRAVLSGACWPAKGRPSLYAGWHTSFVHTVVRGKCRCGFEQSAKNRGVQDSRSPAIPSVPFVRSLQATRREKTGETRAPSGSRRKAANGAARWRVHGKALSSSAASKGFRIASTPQRRAATRERPRYLGKKVRVLVRIDVRHADTRRLQLPNLRLRLARDLILANTPKQQIADKAGRVPGEMPYRHFPAGWESRSDGRQGRPSTSVHMAANAKRGREAASPHGVRPNASPVAIRVVEVIAPA